MNRRTFAQLFAAATGSLSAVPTVGQEAAAGAQDSRNDKPRKRRRRANRREAVNVKDFRQQAKARLPRPTFDYITTGSADGITLRENVAAFRRLAIAPPLLKGVSHPDLSTTVLGTQISMPVLLAPVAAQRMYHPEGALAAARAAQAAQTIFAVSSSAGSSVEEVTAVSPGPKWFQLYVPNNRDVAKKLVERVEGAGYEAIVVTVDLGEWKDADRRNRFTLPKEMLVKHLRDTGYSEVHDGMSHDEVLAFNLDAWDISLSWDIFDWLRGITDLPLLIKGVLRPEDARKAVSIGLDGLIVSNHGGRRLDTMPASIAMLPGVVAAVDGKAEVLLDSGVRRGTDVLKAIALGAKAVLIGRPYAWALAVDGQRGVRKVLELFREEFTNAMVACGCRTVNEIDRTLVLT